MGRTLVWICWNLFLAVLPVFFADRLAHQARRSRQGQSGLAPAIALWAVLWLFFLPNTCYLLTEWRHWFDALHTDQLWPRWSTGYDRDAFSALVGWTVFYFLFSGAGVLSFWAAVAPLAELLRGWRWRSLTGALLFWLNGLGVYLGLELRFNTWDLLTRPMVVVTHALSALRHTSFIVYVSGFAVLLWLLYQLTETLAVGWRQRFQPQRTSA